MATGLIYGALIAVITEMRDERNDRNDKLIAGMDAAGAVMSGLLGSAAGPINPIAGAAVTGVAGGIGGLATTAISQRLARKSANMTELIDRVLCKFNTEVLRRADLGYLGTNLVFEDPWALRTKDEAELYKASAVNVLILVCRQEGVYLDDVARTANSLPLRFMDPDLRHDNQLLHQEPEFILP